MNLARNDKAMSFFVHHVVGIMWRSRIKGELHTWTASGFPIEVNGTSWLATAGHVAKDIRDEIEGGVLDRLYLTDTWEGPDGKGRPIICDPHPDDIVVVGSDPQVLDLGAIKLSGMNESGLRNSKTVFVKEEEWRRPLEKYDSYWILGFPGELVEPKSVEGRITELSMPRALFSLVKVDRPEAAGATHHERFYGRIQLPDGMQADRIVRGIEGVSGGPLFGGRQVDGGKILRPIAVQAAWIEGLKTVTADYLHLLGDELAKLPK